MIDLINHEEVYIICLFAKRINRWYKQNMES